MPRSSEGTAHYIRNNEPKKFACLLDFTSTKVYSVYLALLVQKYKYLVEEEGILHQYVVHLVVVRLFIGTQKTD